MIAIIGGNRTLLSNASSVSSNYEVVTMKYKEAPIMAHIKTADEEYITNTALLAGKDPYWASSAS